MITEHAAKLRDIPARLDGASTVADMDMPGFRAVTVRANWRAIFRVAGRDVRDVDYVDYH